MMHHQRVVSLWDMLSSITGRTFAAAANIGQMVAMLYDAAENADNSVVAFKPGLLESVQNDLYDIARIAIDLDLDATSESIRYALDLCGRASQQQGRMTLSRSDCERLSWTMQMVRMNFATQMQTRLVIVLGTKHSCYLTSEDPPFGREVEDTFPTASEEVSEAAKCLALQRPTAVVFHLMRAMELAVQSCATATGGPDPSTKTWGIILADLSRQIEAMPKGAGRDAWSACHSHLYHVKQAWRNDTMHPKTTYTEAQAEQVFEAVKSFMIHLAPLVVASGRP